MPSRTFKGFLQTYCRELAGSNTLSMRKLVALADGSAPRVAEPLFLLALEQGKVSYLCSLAQGTWMEHEYNDLAKDAVAFAGEAHSFALLDQTPHRYQNVARAYDAQWDELESGRRMTGLLRGKTLDCLQRAGVSAYRLFADTGVNKGNGYAYLLHGDVAKVSYETACRLFEQARAYQAA